MTRPLPEVSIPTTFESDDPNQVGISLAERERRLRKYLRGEQVFTMRTFSALTGISVSQLGRYRDAGLLGMQRIGLRKYIIPFADALAYLTVTRGRMSR